MFRKFSFLVFALLITNFIGAQTTEELQAQKDAKEAELGPLKAQLEELTGKVGTLEGEVASLTDQLTPYPRWDLGAFGTVGFNISQFKNWYSNENPDAFTSSFGITGNGFANMDQKKYFWRNSGNIVFQKTKLSKNAAERDSTDFETTADAFSVSSLFGYKLTEKIAASVLGEYRSNFSKINNPGYLDLGVGATWTPISALVVVFHPLNYNFVFSEDEFSYESSLGCKIKADYARKLPKGIGWSSNLSAFLSYSDINNLSNWTWVNSLSAKIWKGLGVGFDLGLRGNKQETFNSLNENPDITKVKDYKGDNPVQVYWIIGLSYEL